MRSWFFRTLRRAAWAPLAVFVFYVVAAKGFDAYLRWPNLDMPTHFCGGMAITYFYLVAIDYAQVSIGLVPRVIGLLLAVSLTALTAVVWEFLEFLSDAALGTKMNLGVSDTLSDLFFGILGAVVIATVAALRSVRATTSAKSSP